MVEADRRRTKVRTVARAMLATRKSNGRMPLAPADEAIRKSG